MLNLIKNAVLAGVILVIFSCEREFAVNNGSNAFTFSVDTLMFDTVFTEVGSATLNFRIYNPHDEDYLIDKVELAGGDESDFRLNINGYAENSVENLRINAQDSLYVFVEVTVEPEDTNAPFIVSDSVIIQSGDLLQKVYLMAYGQNVEVYNQAYITSTTFTNEKPYLIYDYLVVTEGETLTIQEGTNLHFHNNASLIVFGTLNVEGTQEDPVMFLGDRLEDWYADKPGQWNRIHLMPGSKNNVINYAEIRNCLMGLVVDSVGIGDEQPLAIDNTIIDNVSEYGIIAQNSNITASNLVVGAAGVHSIALTFGGEYNFYHCTLANYFSISSYYRSTPALLFNNYFTNDEEIDIVNPSFKANFYNSIIYGRNSSELGFDFIEDDSESQQLNTYLFQNCVIKSGDTDVSGENQYIDVITNVNPNFIDEYSGNYQLDTLSVCKDAADTDIAKDFPFDILNVNRIEDVGPDIGAYERVEAE